MVTRFVWLMLIVCISIGLFVVFLPQTNKVRVMQRKKAELEAENRRIEAETGELRDHQRRFETDPLFVERTAREQGMIKPGEVVFHLTGSARGEAGLPPPEE